MSQRVLFYKKDEKIIESGGQERRMYIILEGSVEIYLSHNQERVPVARLKKGDFFGEISLFVETPRSAHVVALLDCSLAYIDDLNQLKTFLGKNPSFAAKMVQILCQRLAETDKLLIGKVSEINRLKLLA